MQWLKNAAAISLMGWLVAVPAKAQEAEADLAPVTQEQTQVLPLLDERYRRMTVPVTINGQGPFQFMIDTGAQATVLSHALADHLQLTGRQATTLVGMASTREIQTTQIPELGFGTSSRFDALAALVEADNIGGADGILGLDSLQDQRILLDFENRLIEIADLETAIDRNDYDIVVKARRVGDQMIIARARLDGVRTAVIVDTGAQGSIANDALSRRLRRSRHSGEAEMTDINGVQQTSLLRVVRSLDLGRAQLSNFLVTFVESPTFAMLGLADEPALILGMNELRVFERVAIDFPSRRVMFDLPDGSRLPTLPTFGRLGEL
ncbi:retropepsin-like aspartic protease [Alteraurantiacibacter aestuarii]|uniref:Peptidase A2 domain-containing protein n=1 Tax=Alteraurantiacibacter aestuarii TaxID=650004 RepID=A0A844ZJY6_9SPHN|nr:retroviral-like aspartic protease family protein [Alteraurantiacibacter aestuarii]MXO87456.1 hypothetical protein [Alteraurantiacibacter aestuarii]